MVVGELVVLKKCYPPLEGSHQEDSGGDLGCEGAHLESAAGGSHQEDSGGDWEYVGAPLEGQLMFPVLKKW